MNDSVQRLEQWCDGWSKAASSKLTLSQWREMRAMIQGCRLIIACHAASRASFERTTADYFWGAQNESEMIINILANILNPEPNESDNG